LGLAGHLLSDLEEKNSEISSSNDEGDQKNFEDEEEDDELNNY